MEKNKGQWRLILRRSGLFCNPVLGEFICGLLARGLAVFLRAEKTNHLWWPGGFRDAQKLRILRLMPTNISCCNVSWFSFWNIWFSQGFIYFLHCQLAALNSHYLLCKVSDAPKAACLSSILVIACASIPIKCHIYMYPNSKSTTYTSELLTVCEN